MAGAQRFTTDVAITFVGTISVTFVGFVITVVLGRYLGPDDLGLYKVVLSLFSILVLVAAFGIPTALVKFVAEGKEVDRTVSSGVFTLVVLGIGTGILLYGLSDAVSDVLGMDELSVLLKVLSPVFPFALANTALLSMMNGLRRMGRYAAATILQNVLILVVSLTFIGIGWDVRGVVLGMVVASALTTGYLVTQSLELFSFSMRRYLERTKELLSFGWQVLVANGLNLVIYQGDIILVAYFLTSTDVGYYGVAVGLSRFLWLLPVAVQTISFPATAKLWGETAPDSLRLLLNRSMVYTSCILMPIALGASILSKEIVSFLYGPMFDASALPLSILVTGSAVYGIATSVGGSLSAIGRPDLSARLTALSATAYLLLAVVLIPEIGVLGAAFSTVASYCLTYVIMMLLIGQYCRVKLDHAWHAKHFTLFVVFWLAGIFLNSYSLVIAPVLVGAYVIVVFYVLLGSDDRRFFVELIRRYVHL